jgi:hypothetical protein
MDPGYGNDCYSVIGCNHKLSLDHYLNVRGKPCRTTDLAVYSRQQDPPGRNGFDMDHDVVQTASEVSGVAYGSDCEGTLTKIARVVR